MVERRIGSYLPYLGVGHGQQLEYSGTSRQGLSNLFQHGELRTARKDEASVCISVHHTLDIRQKVRGIMHFVENHALRVLVQKSDRVVFGKAPHVEVLQRVVRQVRKQITDQRRLAGLSGPGNGYDRKVTVRLFYHGG